MNSMFNFKKLFGGNNKEAVVTEDIKVRSDEGKPVANKEVPELIKYKDELESAIGRSDSDLKSAVENKEPLLITPPDALKEASSLLIAKYFNGYWMGVATGLMFKDDEWRELGVEMKSKIESANLNKDRADMEELHEKLNELLQKGRVDEEDGMVRTD